MEKDYKATGYVCAGLRTFVLGVVILFFTMTALGSFYRGLNAILPNIIIIIILLMIIVVTWIYALLGGPFRYIKRFCNQSANPEETMKRIESAWDNKFSTPNCLVSDEYFVWARKLRAVVIPLEEIYGIDFEEGSGFVPNFLRIYLKDNTMKRLPFRGTQGRKIMEYIEQNMDGIVIGERATLGLQRTLVGKINTRYQIVRIRERFFIVDYANPGKLSSYLSFGEKFRFSSHKTRGFWRAWEISEEELQKIKYKPLVVEKAPSGTFHGVAFGFVLLMIAFLNHHPIAQALPINDLVGGQSWLLLLIIASVVLIYVLFLNITTKFDTIKYPEIRISRKNAGYTKNQLFLYIIARVIVLSVLLFFLINMFIWNAGLIFYIIFTFGLFCYIFGGLGGIVSIDPRSTVSVLYKKVKSKEKRRIVKWKERNASGFELGKVE